MTELLSPSLIQFHGNTLLLLESEGEPYAPMKPIVEGMGLSWQGQHAKLAADPKRWGIKMILIPTDSGAQDTLCMHLRKLPSWLSQLNPKKVKPEIRETVTLYRDECDEALWNYWTKGRAERALPTGPLGISTTDDRKPLRSLVNAWAIASGLQHQVLWAQVRCNFNLSRIDELPAAWIPDALAFVQARIDGIASTKALPPANPRLDTFRFWETKHGEVHAAFVNVGRAFNEPNEAMRARLRAVEGEGHDSSWAKYQLSMLLGLSNDLIDAAQRSALLVAGIASRLEVAGVIKPNMK